MSKKFVYLMLLVIVMVMMLSGCGQEGNYFDELEKDSPASLQQKSSTVPDRPADIVGKVDTIIGNEVTLLVAEFPENSEQRTGKNKQGEYREMNSKEKEDKRAEFKNIDPEKMQEQRDKSKSIYENNLQYTGEKETFIIPVGTPVISSARVAKGTNMKEDLDIADIHEGIVLQVWFKQGDNNEDSEVESVRIIQS